MITFRKAKKLLAIGDVVYTSNGKEVVPAKVLGIHQDSLVTDVDVLFYDDHGECWWLTERVAREKV